MTSLADRKDLTLQLEERFAFDLSREVMEAPTFSFWMIFIPIFLVYHVYQHKRIVEGRKSSSEPGSNRSFPDSLTGGIGR
jgi:hypothetical protein